MSALSQQLSAAAASYGPQALRVALAVLLALLVVRALRAGLGRALRRSLPSHQALLIERALVYGVVGAFGLWGLRELGFDPGVLLGAAGIATVALGFAAQTSVSNIISGLFLLGEQPFRVGDMIEIDGVQGEVLTIDLLSIKLRTFDNLYVRLPNEAVLRSRSTTFTRFPLRRFDLSFAVSAYEDLDRLEAILQSTCEANTVCLAEPRPSLMFGGVEACAVRLTLTAWSATERHLELKRSLGGDVLRALADEGVALAATELRLAPSQGDAHPVRSEPPAPSA